jgi:hypothetical protein
MIRRSPERVVLGYPSVRRHAVDDLGHELREPLRGVSLAHAGAPRDLGQFPAAEHFLERPRRQRLVPSGTHPRARLLPVASALELLQQLAEPARAARRASRRAAEHLPQNVAEPAARPGLARGRSALTVRHHREHDRKERDQQLAHAARAGLVGPWHLGSPP